MLLLNTYPHLLRLLYSVSQLMCSHPLNCNMETTRRELSLLPTTRSTYEPGCVDYCLHLSFSWDAKSPHIKGWCLPCTLLKNFFISPSLPCTISPHLLIFFPAKTQMFCMNPLIPKASTDATFLSAYSLTYGKTSPKYCLTYCFHFFIYKLLINLFPSGSEHGLVKITLQSLSL